MEAVAPAPPTYQKLVLAALVAGLSLTCVGAAIGLAGDLVPISYSVLTASIGLVLTVVGLALAHPLRSLSFLDDNTGGGERYDRQKRWGRLKIASVLLNLLSFLSAFMLMGAVLYRWEILRADFQNPTVARLDFLLLAALCASLFAATYLALRSPTSRAFGRVERGVFIALAGIGGSLAVVASLIAIDVLPAPNVFRLVPSDAPYLLLAAATAASFGAFISHRLPTLYALVTQQPGSDRTAGFVSRNKSVVFPVVAALAFLFLVLFVFIIFQVGLTDLAQDIPRNGVLLATIGLIMAACVGSVWASLWLSRGEEPPKLYQTRRTPEERRSLAIRMVSFSVAGALFFAALILFFQIPFFPASWPRRYWIDFVVFGTIAAIGPYGIYLGLRARHIQKVEERFPDFLRDLAAGRRAGLTLEAAVNAAAGGDYGELGPEIQKMSEQLSWNVPFDEVLTAFAGRVRTPLVDRSVSLIVAASRTGGHVTDVLTTAASDARELKTLETERRGAMKLYTLVSYVIFLVFLLTVAVLYGTFVPKALAASAGAKVGSTGDSGVPFVTTPLEAFRTFYFLAALVQAIGTGIVAGVFETGRALSGLRHACYMVLICWITFAWVV